MKRRLAVMAVLAATAVPALAVMDDFEGDLSSWQFIADSTFSADTTQLGDGNNVLHLTSDYPPALGGTEGSTFVGGINTGASGGDLFLSSVVNAGTFGGTRGNDMGIIARLQMDQYGPTAGYGLNYDPHLHKLELVEVAAGGQFSSLPGGSYSMREGDFGTEGQEVLLKMQLLTINQNLLIVGQAWEADGSALLGEVQVTVDSEDVVGAGYSGLYAAVNSNENENGGFIPNPINAGFDDFFTRAALAGDVNLDGVVNVGDLAILAANYGNTGLWSSGDLTGDGAVDIGDLALLASAYGTSVETLVVAPEPTTVALLGVGAFGLLRRRRR